MSSSPGKQFIHTYSEGQELTRSRKITSTRGMLTASTVEKTFSIKRTPLYQMDANIVAIRPHTCLIMILCFYHPQQMETVRPYLHDLVDFNTNHPSQTFDI